jgi:hypothetical protein
MIYFLKKSWFWTISRGILLIFSKFTLFRPNNFVSQLLADKSFDICRLIFIDSKNLMPVTAIWLTLALLLIDKSFDKHPKCPFSTSHYTCYAYATIVTSTVTDSWRIHNYNKVLFGLNKLILMLLRSSEKSVSKLFYHLKLACLIWLETFGQMLQIERYHWGRNIVQ